MAIHSCVIVSDVIRICDHNCALLRQLIVSCDNFISRPVVSSSGLLDNTEDLKPAHGQK